MVFGYMGIYRDMCIYIGGVVRLLGDFGMIYTYLILGRRIE